MTPVIATFWIYQVVLRFNGVRGMRPYRYWTTTRILTWTGYGR